MRTIFLLSAAVLCFRTNQRLDSAQRSESPDKCRLLFTAANTNLVALPPQHDILTGQVFSLFIITLAAHTSVCFAEVSKFPAHSIETP